MKNKKNLILLTSLGYLLLGDKKKDLLKNQDKREFTKRINNEESSKYDDKKEIISENIDDLYQLEDYEYYTEYQLNYEKNNNIFDFKFNDISYFKIVEIKENEFNLEISIKFIVKKIKLKLVNLYDNVYTFNVNYKPNFLEKLFLKINFNYLKIDFTMKISDDLIILELLNVNETKNILEVVEKYNLNLFDFLKRKNFNLKFNKK